MNWYLKVLKQYFDFSGRARRMEFWMFTLFQIIIAVGLMFLDMAIGTTIGEGVDQVGMLYLVYILATIIPTLAVSVRRLHDTGKSGWWYLINFIPLVGPLVFLVFVCMEGESRTNQWGPNPKGLGNDREIDFIGKE